MSTVPQLRSVTDLQKNYTGVLADIANGPVFLLQRQTVAAVMVSPTDWERLQNELAEVKRGHLALLTERREASTDEFVSLDDALAGVPIL